MSKQNRRSFLKHSGLLLTPVFIAPAVAQAADKFHSPSPADDKLVNFFSDGEFFDGPAYWQQLEEAFKKNLVKPDRYGSGGAVEELEKRMAAATGKEKAIYMPSGTMANQLAIAVLSGENTKVFVQDTSHVYRDEADAAQSVYNKRLMPLAKEETYFTADQLKKAIDNLGQEEVFKSGIGCVSIENPVRRTDERMVPLEEIKKISAYCRSNNIKLHLDGARLYIASAWSGVPVKEYASYFDTVYISLYKYFGASGGAMLCGDAAVIDKMPHLIKIHGGNMFGNWLQAAMALHRMDGFEGRLEEAKKRANEIFKALEAKGITITHPEGGTNTYIAKYPKGINGQKLAAAMREQQILTIRPNADNEGRLVVNETLLYREPSAIISAFELALKKAT